MIHDMALSDGNIRVTVPDGFQKILFLAVAVAPGLIILIEIFFLQDEECLLFCFYVGGIKGDFIL